MMVKWWRKRKLSKQCKQLEKQLIEIHWLYFDVTTSPEEKRVLDKQYNQVLDKLIEVKEKMK